MLESEGEMTDIEALLRDADNIVQSLPKTPPMGNGRPYYNAVKFIEDLAAAVRELQERYVSMTSHLEGPYGIAIDEPGNYEILLKIHPDGSGFCRTVQKRDPITADTSYPNKEWRDFHDVFKRATKAESEVSELKEEQLELRTKWFALKMLLEGSESEAKRYRTELKNLFEASFEYWRVSESDDDQDSIDKDGRLEIQIRMAKQALEQE